MCVYTYIYIYIYTSIYTGFCRDPEAERSCGTASVSRSPIITLSLEIRCSHE